jgi:hypothetical protein
MTDRDPGDVQFSFVTGARVIDWQRIYTAAWTALTGPEPTREKLRGAILQALDEDVS